MRQRGHIRRRGERSWEIKLDCGRDETGKRIIHYHSVKGTEQDAKKKPTALLKSQDDGAYVAPTKETVANFVRARVTGRRQDTSPGVPQSVTASLLRIRLRPTSAPSNCGT